MASEPAAATHTLTDSIRTEEINSIVKFLIYISSSKNKSKILV
jgi:hypothetical protein